MLDFMQYNYVRAGYYMYNKSIRQLSRETGHCRKTIRKVLKGEYPKYKLTKSKSCPVLGEFKEVINEWLTKDQELPRKQRHSAVRIYHRLQEEYGYQGSESNIRKYVSKLKKEMGLSKKETFIPLEQTFGEAEIDWGEALVRVSGKEKKAKIFSIRAQGSGAIFVRAYPSENQESFLDAHIHAFNFFGGVFKLIRYDNLKTAVQKVLKGTERKEQEKFRQFHQYYCYHPKFCNPGRGNEKGGIEGIVGYSRRNFLVPVPDVQDFEELNDILSKRCVNYQKRKVGERKLIVEDLLLEEQKNLLPLPVDEFPVWKLKTVKVDHYSTVRFENNRYSVPTDYGYRDLELRATPFKITLFDKPKQIAEHKRSYQKEQWILEPLHYLKLLSRKPRAFDRAKPISVIKESWPKIYERLLLTLKDKYGDSNGKKQFIEILLLQKKYSSQEVEAAVEIVLETGGASFEVVNHMLNWIYQDEKKTDSLLFDVDSHLAKIHIPKQTTFHYGMLIGGENETTN